MEILAPQPAGPFVDQLPLDADFNKLPPSPPQTIRNGGTSTPASEKGAMVSSSLCLFEELDAERERVYPLPTKPTINSVLPEDLKTPDSFVTRDPRLIRLTGVHPYNVEAPLSDLYEQGFITNKDLHYVRNHGAVPKVEDQDMLDWEFSVEGMVEKPFTLTLRDLITEYEQITYPVTLVCAGNRRKEQNVVRKTKGFSWGAAGLSTALWTGVSLGDLLARAMPKRGARYVYFEGADKLPNGNYGTNIKLNWAMDPNRGVTVCYRMNGELLHPDHGRPVRIIIPGQIGGRSVKWLKKIVVNHDPSDNWYHIYDNRVLPTDVSPEASADLPDTWKDERYAIYDLNANSATCFPAHDETISLKTGPESYKVRGYAYGGGGRRITRVELTLDKGRTWTRANISYPEDDYRLAPEGDTLYGGKMDMSWRESSFCWCFWDFDVPVARLAEADDIMVRCMDEGMMVQPRDMYWSVLGMMNNPWFRVVIHKDAHDTLRFEHPTLPALRPGGWMERVKKAGGNLTNGFWGENVKGEAESAVEAEPVKEICMTKEGVKRVITLEELRQHSGEQEPWFVVNGEVYDGTPYLEGHPGGAASIIGAAGQDASEEFLAIHSENAKAMMPTYHIGTLDEASRKQLASGEEEAAPETNRAVFLQNKTWAKALMTAKSPVSDDSKIFTFDLDTPEQTIGLPVGQHLMIRVRDPVTREAIIRAYTPLSEGTDKGKLDILIKVYETGKMTRALDSMPLGHWIEFKGPVGKFIYEGRGLCTVGGKQRNVKRFVMICGGSGITPIFQVLRAVMKDAEDQTKCLVLDGNRMEQDILCRTDLDTMAAANPDKCKLVYTLSKGGDDWAGLRGRMDAPFFQRELGPCLCGAGEEMVLICGPEAMEKSVKTIMLGLGWKEDDLLFF
ncbi:nitrate reductase [Plectosphaerella cucumerina]|uniref:Nitrate reductase n=1 Tax=Plectosphaerella cucumerina TaxID=40658 RepID=A0A8K0TS01_9PEZI|nr:nitrate reductase [Plectosphaerella cucumerina]